MRKSLLLIVAAAALAAPAGAQKTGTAANQDVRINQLIVYGDDPCPKSSNEEITVCARRPEGDRYRIPEALRDEPNFVGNTAWATRARELQYVGRTGIQSCSPVGPGGATGCLQQLITQAMAERGAGDGTNWRQLVEEARQARLGKIDEDSEEIERQVKEEEARRATP